MIYQPGASINEKYKILSELGEGGFGVVYKAEDISLERTVALKVFKSNLLLNADDLVRIKNEAKVLAKLTHPNIVTVFALEMIADAVPVVVMEYIEGKSLEKQIAENGVDAACFNAILTQVCSALQYAHENGVIHRDLSPRNILLIESDNKITAKVIDFGLSKLVNPNPEGQLNATPTITATGYLAGNPQYMSPELCLGKKADPASDIYALGCILYEMLCGHPMFRGADAIGTLYKHQHEYPPPPELSWDARDYEQVYQDITLLCIQKEKSKRPQSAAEIMACLQDQQQLEKRLTDAARWCNAGEKTRNGRFDLRLLACFAAIACALIFLISKRKEGAQQIQLGQARVKHIESKSVMATLLKARDFIDARPGEKPFLEQERLQKERELVQIIGSKRLDPISKLIAYHYRANLLMMGQGTREEKIAALERCLPLSQTSEGHDTQQTATILYQMAVLSTRKEDRYKLAKRAFAVYEKEETKALEIPKELRTAANTVTTAEICNLLAELADEKGNSEEALKWVQTGLNKCSLDPNWRWQQVCIEAGYLKKLGRMKEARASLNHILSQLSESASIDFQPAKQILELSKSNNIRNAISLGDWCAQFGFADIAIDSYQSASKLIERTGLCKELNSSCREKLAAVRQAK